ncbi:MAG: hypothetical protein E7665_02010 [Ruminococcaceae bacterium]|nr:hypothetical protein [Oscillospiraceae bacterium]
MNENTLSDLKKIFRRIYSNENYEKRRKLSTELCNDDETRIWEICKHFWNTDYSQRSLDFEQFEPNPELDDLKAKRYIEELTELLYKLGWK